MKGFKRGMQKNVTNIEQASAYNRMNEQVGSIYGKIGNQIHDLDDNEVDMLSKPKVKSAMMSVSKSKQVPVRRGGGGGGGLEPKIGASYGVLKKATKEATAPQIKAPKSKFAGKQVDSIASELYQMSSHNQAAKYRQPEGISKAKKKM